MSPQVVPLNDAATASLGLCDNDCGRPAVSGFGRGLYKHCSRACERANVTTFDRETVRQLRQESEAAMATAARDSAKDVAAREAAEAEHAGRGRVKVARVPVVTPTQKPVPAPVAAPIQVAAVVAVEPKPKPPNEARRAIYAARPQNQGARFALWPDADKHPNRCRREGCTKKPWSRGLCQACNQGARARKILDEVGLPPKPYASGAIRARTNTVQDQIEAIVRENPSIHLKDLVPMTKFAYRQCYRAVTTMRKNKRLVKPKCHHHDPEYMRLYLVNP